MRPHDGNYPSLTNRIVLITGGGSGIGAGLVEDFCAQRARVAFVNIQAEAGRRLAGRIAASGHPEPLFIPCDLKDIPALRAAVAQVGRELGPVRVLVLVNNAANDDRHRIEDVTVACWDERMAVNLRHQFFAAQAVRPMMKASAAARSSTSARSAG